MNAKFSLKIIFAGTPNFAATALESLLSAHYNIIAVYTQPDRPAGRGQKITASPVKLIAEQRHIPLYQPTTLKNPEEQAALCSLNADLMIVAAYGLLLPLPILKAPRLGCINIHASLLPRWRGAAPIQRAILTGDTQTGISIMQMDEGLDTGPVLYEVSCPIEPKETSQTLYERLERLGAEAITKALELIEQGKAHPRPQDEKLATYASKIQKQEAQLDWRLPAVILERQVRGFNPWPVAFTTSKDKTLRIWSSEVIASKQDAKPGTIVKFSKEGIEVTTGEGLLRLRDIQLPGGRILQSSDLLNSPHPEFAVGCILGEP